MLDKCQGCWQEIGAGRVSATNPDTIMTYVYIVWFRDTSLPENDQDHEWPACFLIEGTVEKTAQTWGDYLAKKYAHAQGVTLLHSSLETVTSSTLPGLELLPVIREGHEASDEQIGW